MVRKRRRGEYNEPVSNDDDEEVVKVKRDDDDDEDDEDGKATIPLEEAEEEEEAEEKAEENDDVQFVQDKVEDLEKRRLFQIDAEEVLEHLTMDEVREVLKERKTEPRWALRLKKLLSVVIQEGKVDSWEDAWEEALERLQEEI